MVSCVISPQILEGKPSPCRSKGLCFGHSGVPGVSAAVGSAPPGWHSSSPSCPRGKIPPLPQSLLVTAKQDHGVLLPLALSFVTGDGPAWAAPRRCPRWPSWAHPSPGFHGGCLQTLSGQPPGPLTIPGAALHAARISSTCRHLPPVPASWPRPGLGFPSHLPVPSLLGSNLTLAQGLPLARLCSPTRTGSGGTDPGSVADQLVTLKDSGRVHPGPLAPLPPPHR